MKTTTCHTMNHPVMLTALIVILSFGTVTNPAFCGSGTARELNMSAPEVVEAPDLSALEHIQERYLTVCGEQPGKDDSWSGFESDLDLLNEKTFKVVAELALNNKEIRRAVEDISRALTKINDQVIGKDIRRHKKKVLGRMEDLKKKLDQTRASIEKVKKRVDESQKTVGDTYCRVDGYVSRYLALADEHEEQGRLDVAKTDANTARRMSEKRMKLYMVLVEFDSYFGLLDKLFDLADHKLDLIDSIQKNIVAFVDTECRDRMTPCVYETVSDLRFNEVELAGVMAGIEEAFAKLVSTAQANFSGSKKISAAR